MVAEHAQGRAGEPGFKYGCGIEIGGKAKGDSRNRLEDHPVGYSKAGSANGCFHQWGWRCSTGRHQRGA